MKRENNLYSCVYNIENIELAHLKARKGKSHYKEVKKIDKSPQKYFQIIHNLLKNKMFVNGAYEKIIRVTDSGKEREILKLPYFPDRIVHHAVMNIVEPIWFRNLIRDSYSAVKGRGIHDGVERVRKALQDKDNTVYCLKLDVKKFYPSIDNEVLKSILRKKIKDNDLLWLLDTIIDSVQGIPIGNYLSQYFGNLYLSGLDHYIKEDLRVRYYFRYCDDMVLLGTSKKDLHSKKLAIERYINENLKLKIKENWQVFPVETRGIDFLGYVFYHEKILMRKSIKNKMIKRISKIKKNWRKMTPDNVLSSLMSYYGWMKYCNSKSLFNKYFDDEIFFIAKQKSRNIGVKNPLQGKV